MESNLIKESDLRSKDTSEFIPHKIEDIAEEMGDAPFGSNLKNVDYTESGALVVQGKNIQGLRFDWSTKRHVSIEKWASIPRSQCFVGDLIFPKVGTIGKVGILTPCDGYDNYLLSTNTMRLKVNTNIAVQKYVYYFFSWNKTVHLINAMSSTSVQPVFNYTTLKRFTINLPPLQEQKAIAHILGSLDDKIELNRQMNETLEAMAQALFKSWFVDFDPVIDNALTAAHAIPEVFAERAAQRKAMNKDEVINPLFPDAFEYTEEMGWIPKGWGVSNLADLTTELRRGISPKYTEEEGVKVVNQRCIREHKINFSVCRINDVSLRKVEGRFLEVGDLLVNSTGVGTLGRMAQVTFLDEPTVVDSHVTVVRPNPEKYKPYSFAQMMISIEPHVESMGLGSTGQTELSRTDLSELKTIVPSIELQQITEDIFIQHAEKIVLNSKQNISLSKLRDTLLPKLLSGELRIPDAEKLVEEAQT